MTDTDIGQETTTEPSELAYELPHSLLMRTLYAIGAIQALGKKHSELTILAEWIDEAADTSNLRLASCLFDIEMHLGQEVHLWPQDPSNPRAVKLRQAVNGMKKKFEETGLALDAPQSNSI